MAIEQGGGSATVVPQRRTTGDTRVAPGTNADGAAPAPAPTPPASGAWPTDPNGNPLPITTQQTQALTTVANQTAGDIGSSESMTGMLQDFQNKLTATGLFTADQVEDVINGVTGSDGGLSTIQDKNGGNTSAFVSAWVGGATSALQNALAALNPNPLNQAPGSGGAPTNSSTNPGTSTTPGTTTTPTTNTGDDPEMDTLTEDLLGILPGLEGTNAGGANGGGSGSSGTSGSLGSGPTEPLYTVDSSGTSTPAAGGNPLGIVLIAGAAFGGYIYWKHKHGKGAETHHGGE